MKSAATQAVHLTLEGVEDDVLCLVGGQYRAVLEVGSVTFGLQGEREHEAIVASYAAFLNSLTFPIQIVVRVLPIDVDGYLGHLEQCTRHLAGALAELGSEYRVFLQQLARNRTLLEWHFYLIVPADEGVSPLPRSWLFARQRQDLGPDAARRQLTFRCDEVAHQLGRSGLTVRRLSSQELVRLCYACWCPELARIQRVRSELIDLATPVVHGRKVRGRRS